MFLTLGVGEWTEWSKTCSKKCNTGTNNRTRECLEKSGTCAKHLKDERNCNTEPCPGKSGTL